MTDRLEYIQSLLSQGFKVLPLTKDCKPLLGGGYASASGDAEQIAAWSETYLNCNWGIRTGKESKIIVVDLDPRNGSAETVLQLRREGKTLPSTYTVQSARKGLHLYYRLPEGMDIPTFTELLPGLDIISEGKYIVAGYSFKETAEYSGSYIPTTEEFEFAEFPLWLLELIKNKSAPIGGVRPSGPTATEAIGELSKATYKFLAEGAAPGGWNAALFKAAKDFQEQGYGIEEAIEKLSNVTGYLDKTDSKTIQSAFKKVPKHPPRDVLVNEVNGNTTPLGGSVLARVGMESLAGEQVGSPELITAQSLFGEVTNFLSNKEAIRGTPVGLEPFDEVMGGLRASEVTVLHGEAKAGKSSFLNKLIHSLLSSGQSVGFASREMDPAKEVVPALLSVELGTNAWKANYTSELEAKLRGTSWLNNLYFSPGYGYMPLDEFSRWTLALKEKGVNVVFLDHLHYSLIEPEDHKAAALLIREVKTLAMKTGMHFIVVVQANKLMEDQKLGRNSLKGGAAISQTLNNLVTIERMKPQDVDGLKNVTKVELQFARSPLAKPGTFFLQYQSETTDMVIVDTFQKDPPEQLTGNVFPFSNQGVKKY